MACCSSVGVVVAMSQLCQKRAARGATSTPLEAMTVVGRNVRIAVKTSIDHAIAHIADGQHGNITREQLLALGLSNHAIAHRVKIGRLFRVYRGVYAVGRRPKTALEHAA